MSWPATGGDTACEAGVPGAEAPPPPQSEHVTHRDGGLMTTVGQAVQTRGDPGCPEVLGAIPSQQRGPALSRGCSREAGAQNGPQRL